MHSRPQEKFYSVCMKQASFMTSIVSLRMAKVIFAQSAFKRLSVIHNLSERRREPL